MGDRANIFMKDSSIEEDNGVYFYTHWSGEALPETLQIALRREIRWFDPIYLGRIIFSEMIKDFVGAETGYGISGFIGDGFRRILWVDSSAQEVRAMVNDKIVKTWLFKDYIEVDFDDPENRIKGW